MPALRKLPYFTQPQALYAIEAVLSHYGPEPSAIQVHVAGNVLGFVAHTRNARISNGTLAAVSFTSESTLKRVLRLMIDARLIEQSFGDGPGKMASYTLGKNAQGEAWEQAWKVGTQRFRRQIGLNCKESKCGEYASSIAGSYWLTGGSEPTFNPVAEKGLSDLISEAAPATEKGLSDLISLEKGIFGQEKGLSDLGTDRAFDLAELNTEPDPVFSSGFPAVRLFNQPPQGEGNSPSLLDDLRHECQSESSKEERSSQDDAELFDQPGPERPTASQAQVQTVTSSDKNNAASISIKGLGVLGSSTVNATVNKAAHTLNDQPRKIRLGDHVLLNDRLCIVVGHDWDQQPEHYTVKDLKSDKTQSVVADQLSHASTQAIVEPAA